MIDVPTIWLPPSPAIIQPADSKLLAPPLLALPMAHRMFASAGGRLDLTSTATDSNGASSAQVITFSGKSIGAAASDRVVIVAAGFFSTGTGYTLSIAGSVATKIITSEVAIGGGFYNVCGIWARAVSAGTTADVAVDRGGAANSGQRSIYVSVYRLTGTGGSVTATETDTDSAVNGAPTVSVASGQVMVACSQYSNNAAHTVAKSGDISEDFNNVDIQNNDGGVAGHALLAGSATFTSTDSTQQQATQAAAASWG